MTTFANLSSRRNFAKTLYNSLRLPSCLKDTCHSFAARMVSCQSSGLAMKGASREGDWNLHLSSIRNLIPWCFAYDNINYARYLSSYLSEMSHLEDEHADVFTYMKSGGFAVRSVRRGQSFW